MLDPVLVVLAIRTPGEPQVVIAAPPEQTVVDELAAVVAQWEGQALVDRYNAAGHELVVQAPDGACSSVPVVARSTATSPVQYRPATASPQCRTRGTRARTLCSTG